MKETLVKVVKFSDLLDFNVGQQFEIVWVDRQEGLVGIKWI